MSSGPTRHRVLIVEDDPALRDAYRQFFCENHADEFLADLVADAEQALQVIKHEPVDTVILDWNLPNLPGVALARALRESAKTSALGIVMITARTTAPETVQALEAGADDYLSKPFDWNVLLARLRSLKRRRAVTLGARAMKTFPGMELDLDAARLVLDGRFVRLSPKEFQLFAVLAARPGIVHTHSFLWESVWGYESPTWLHVLKVTMSSLRQKLGRKWGTRLASRTGQGYVFDPEA